MLHDRIGMLVPICQLNPAFPALPRLLSVPPARWSCRQKGIRRQTPRQFGERPEKAGGCGTLLSSFLPTIFNAFSLYLLFNSSRRSGSVYPHGSPSSPARQKRIHRSLSKSSIAIALF